MLLQSYRRQGSEKLTNDIVESAKMTTYIIFEDSVDIIYLMEIKKLIQLKYKARKIWHRTSDGYYRIVYTIEYTK